MHLFHTWSNPKYGYQSCTICGKTRVVGCHHNWEEKGQVTGEYQLGGGTFRIWVLRCTRCGDMKEFRIG